MKTVIKSLYRNTDEYGGKEITISGWIRNTRISKNFGFIELNDGTFFKNLQIVLEAALPNYAELAKLNIGASITVTGTLVLTPEAKQPFELKAESVTVEGESTPDYPLQPKRHSFEYLRTIAHLRPRTNTFSAVFRVRSMIAYAIHQFFQERGFVYVHTPIITASDCEGAGEMFQVTTMDLNQVPKNDDGSVDYSKDFFGKQANLTVSGQLNVETYCMAFRNVYTFGPTFRAENSNTTRHAAEFWMIEAVSLAGGYALIIYTLPIIWKWGNINGRTIAVLLVVGGFFGVMTFVNSLVPDWERQVIVLKNAADIPKAVPVIIGVLAAVLLGAVSYGISLRMIKNKEF